MEYNTIIAAAINTAGVLAVVQFIKTIALPALHQKAPWALPILAGALGPGVAALQNLLAGALGVPIDLSPIAAIATGASAVAVYQVNKQAHKSA